MVVFSVSKLLVKNLSEDLFYDKNLHHCLPDSVLPSENGVVRYSSSLRSMSIAINFSLCGVDTGEFVGSGISLHPI